MRRSDEFQWSGCGSDSVPSTGHQRVLQILGLVFGLLLISVGPSMAQGGFSIGLRAGLWDPTGSPNTFDAVYGGDRMTQVGLDLRYRNAGSFMIQLAADHGTLDGELVIVTNGGTIGSGTTTKLTMTPVHLSFAYVFGNPSLDFYLGAGPTWLDWKDENDFESVSGSDVGFHAVFGLEHRFGKTSLGGELRYSTVSDAIGEGGASEFFGEDDLGGLSAHVVFLFHL